MSDSTAVTSRRRPLFTFGASMLAIAQNLCTRSVELKGPIGSVARRLANATGSVASPLAYWIQFQWLVILSHVDDHILSMEKNVESLIPASSHVFDKLDTLVDKVESLPRKLDEAMINKFPIVLHKVPLLEQGVIYTVKWLEFVTNALMIWGLYHNTKEKEIRVDISSEEQKHNQEDEIQGKASRDSNALKGDDVSSTMKCSYKEALEKGVALQFMEVDSLGDAKDIEENGDEDHEVKEEEAEMEDYDIFTKEDPLLELFDFRWQTPKLRFTMARSASYT